MREERGQLSTGGRSQRAAVILEDLYDCDLLEALNKTGESCLFYITRTTYRHNESNRPHHQVPVFPLFNTHHRYLHPTGRHDSRGHFVCLRMHRRRVASVKAPWLQLSAQEKLEHRKVTGRLPTSQICEEDVKVKKERACSYFLFFALRESLCPLSVSCVSLPQLSPPLQ